MFKTKNLVHDVKDVPIPWIFQHFCKLKEKLADNVILKITSDIILIIVASLTALLILSSKKTNQNLL